MKRSKVIQQFDNANKDGYTYDSSDGCLNYKLNMRVKIENEIEKYY